MEKLLEEGGVKFKCRECGMVRQGNEPKECLHYYEDYEQYDPKKEARETEILEKEMEFPTGEPELDLPF